MNAYNLILKRRTIRLFKQQKIDEPMLKNIVNAGRLAPSGANLQPLEFIIVCEPALVKQIFPAVKWAGYIAPAGNPPEGKRPVAYVIVLINTAIKSKHGEVDAAAAIENMILTALDDGIGSCWMGAIDREQLRTMLHVPPNYDIDSVLSLGYPDESPVIEDMENSIKYWKDAQDVLHVPKRKLEDIIHYNQF